eukprot:COSAG01_NODE_3990_length_5458_cov_2.452323_3_plen_149_part_00
MPYIHDLGPGGKSKPTVIPLTRREHHNFILGTYSTQEAFDTDDGSSYYAMSSNFLVYGSNGLKSDFGGHTHSSIGDIYAVGGVAWQRLEGLSSSLPHSPRRLPCLAVHCKLLRRRQLPGVCQQHVHSELPANCHTHRWLRQRLPSVTG